MGIIYRTELRQTARRRLRATNKALLRRLRLQHFDQKGENADPSILGGVFIPLHGATAAGPIDPFLVEPVMHAGIEDIGDHVWKILFERVAARRGHVRIRRTLQHQNRRPGKLKILLRAPAVKADMRGKPWLARA